MIKKYLRKTAAAVALAAMAGPSLAALATVDPGPYTAATGFFPLYYTDGGAPATTLDLCLSTSDIAPNAALTPAVTGGAACVLLPNPGVFDPARPAVFPFNWPDESFWFTGDASIDAANVQLSYGSALEAAFGGGLPAPNDQISFARIRIRADVPAPGTYTVTHPYGVEVFPVPAALCATPTGPCPGAINATRDIGVAPGIFTGALAGDIGPFIRDVAGPFPGVDPVTGAATGESFIGDPNSLRPVIGSPNNTNFVRITGPAVDFTTNLFAVSGRIWNNQRPTQLAVDRTTYSRNALGTKIDAFATTSPTASVCFRETLDLVAGVPPSPCQFTMLGDGTGAFYAQDPATAAPLPPFVVVTAVDATAVPPTTATPLASALVDQVKITKATYVKSTGTLSVEAASSDEVSVPKLSVFGQGDLVPGTGTATQTLVKGGLAEPPAFVTVSSSAGGSDTEPVIVLAAGNVAPVAAADTAVTNQNVPVTIAVLANDTDADNNLPLTVVSVSTPANGQAAVNLDGTVTYTPNPSFAGTDSFTYQAQDSLGALSNVATVTITVRIPPIANADTATVANRTLTNNSQVSISVLANDTDPDGNLPLAIDSFTQPANGVVTLVLGPPRLLYRPNIGFAGTNTFTYVARDTSGALSAAATVTVTVTNAAPTANPDSATTVAGTAVTIPVLANDTDPEGNTPLSVINVANVVGGTVTNNGTSVTFNPTGATPGSFTYQARDNLGAVSNTATVTVAVAAGAAVDVDIQQFSVAVRGRTPTAVATPTVRVRATTAVPAGRSIPVTVTGTGGYNQTLNANGPLAAGATVTLTFPARTFTTPATVTWTATVADDNADADIQNLTTVIR